MQELIWCGEITSEVRAHLLTCARCRAEHATLQGLGLAVETVEIPQPSRSLLPPRAEIEAVIRTHKRRRTTKWLTAGAVAACLALAVTQVQKLWQDSTSTTPGDVSLVTPNPQPNPQPNSINATADRPLDQQILGLLNQYGHTAQSEQLQDWTRVDKFVLAEANDEGQLLDQLSRFFQYANVFSQHVQLDLTPYRARSDVSAYLVPLQDQSEEQAVFLVAGGTQVIGAWKRQAGGSELTALDNRHFGELTNIPWAQWVQQQKWENITPEMRARTPEQLLVQYADAKSREDAAAVAGMLTSWSLLRQSLEGGEPTQLFALTNTATLPVQLGLKATDVQVKPSALPAPDPSAVSKLHNRVPAESKVYQVTVPGGTRFVTVVRETSDAPWQIDQFATGP
jgi:hypothetical protein